MVLEVINSHIDEGSGGCGGDPESRCGNGLEKIYPTIVVRYGYMKYLGEFAHEPGMKFSCGAPVVCETHRGTEIGEQVSLSCTGCSKTVSRDQIQSYIRSSGAESYFFGGGRILREANRNDLLEQARIKHDCRNKLNKCRELSQVHQLPMEVVECEHLLGGERLIFYFLSEKRVDFRALVKDLGGEFRTRIEMRQVGARDEARLLADFETCGQECCCKTFLKTLKPVNMKMAKMQKATLDPTKVSGRCGRLKCCLRYEHTSYEELDRLLPRMGRRVKTVHGDGVVVARQILTQLLQIETDDQRRFAVAIEDVLEESRPRAGQVVEPESVDVETGAFVDDDIPREDIAPTGGDDLSTPLDDRPVQPGSEGAGGRGPRGRDRRRPRGSSEPKERGGE